MCHFIIVLSVCVIKMPVLNLLEINPDKLFEEHTIEEIDDVRKVLHDEIERKREDLRTMVGERYRDLIEAADTIAAMKTISQKVIAHIESMKVEMASIKEDLTVRADMRPSTECSGGKVSNAELVAVQVKLLVDMPEYTWTALEHNQFTRATQLFLFARHIKTGLEVEKSLNALATFPVIGQLWQSMAHFKTTILSSVEETLRGVDLDPKTACEGLASLVLLENSTALPLLQRFLVLRSDVLRAVMTTPQRDGDITACFVHSHAILTNTLRTLYACFVEWPPSTEGLVWTALRAILSRDAPPTIALPELQRSEVPTRLLPPVLKEFRLWTEAELDVVSTEAMSSALGDWLAWVRGFVADHGEALLQQLATLSALQSLRDAPQTAPPDDWSTALQGLRLPPILDLWTELYRPLILARAQQLVTLHWQTALAGMCGDIAQSIVTANQIPDSEPELDLRWFTWKESADDLTCKTDSEESSCTRGLWLKWRGFSPRVTRLCSTVETRLAGLEAELATLCPADVGLVDARLAADWGSMRDHQQAQCGDTLNRLRCYIQKELSCSATETSAALVARFLQAMPELCPTLQQCITASDDKVSNWQKARTVLLEESLSAWGVWRGLVVARLTDTIQQNLQPTRRYADVLATTPQWDVVSIEEEGEGGHTHQSDLRVPSAPSFPLHSLLISISSQLARITVPRAVCDQLTETLVHELLTFYAASESLCQANALQQLLDVKYIAALLVPPDNKVLQARCAEAAAAVEGHIDPFDLDVFAPNILSNVKRSVFTTQALLGTVSCGQSSGPAGSRANEDPCMLALSAGAAHVWFPPLPVSAPPGTRPIQPSKPKVVKVGRASSEVTSETTTKPLMAATSFFTDWFG